ncbi:hypothetical protein PVAND_014929 [Polypedilum vanderplanki]|uniref:Arrestin C-terminal-like domain-containing protein n=1 Tax=Polypedilum vanderplanki TaxID=319348 RepID=A0A9J6BAS3_POLVA|nr:hypothetical protein PVAND_014929 [Polypedilum vanderplanki]
MQCTINFVNNPLKVYKPGATIELLIELQVNETINVEEIFLKIIGQAKCEFLSRKKGKPLTACVNYLEKKISLLNISQIEPGMYDFDANFQLPYDIPSTMECIKGYWKNANGSIKYKLEVHVTSLWKPNWKFDNNFTVIAPLDLNQLSPVMHVPLMQEVMRKFSFDFSSKELYMSASIPQRGYTPGEAICVTVNLHNMTRVRIQSVRISLNKIMVLTSQKPIVEVVRILIVETLEYCDQVKPQLHRIFSKTLRVPAVEPNIDNCEIIKVGYEIAVKAKPSGMHRSVLLNIPVLIGTVALKNEQQQVVRRISYSSFETELQ